MENIKIVSSKALSNPEFLKNWTHIPVPLTVNKLYIDAHRIKIEERFRQLSKATLKHINQFESTIGHVLAEQKEFVLSELGTIEQNYNVARKRCRSAQVVI